MAITGKPHWDGGALEDALYAHVTGGPELGRAAFYRMTEKASPEDLSRLEAALRVRLAASGRFEGPKGARRIEGWMRSWFRPWTRLAGRMEAAVEDLARQGGGRCDERMLASVAEEYARKEEYAPYLDREFKGFVLNRCRDLGLDYFALPSGLRYPEGEESFRRDCPFLVGDMEFGLLGMAYAAGRPVRMAVAQEPSLENELVGGEVSWSRYLGTDGPVLPEGRVTGLGQIDYRDCTNAFVVLDGGRRAEPFHDFPVHERRAVLERVYDAVRRSGRVKMEERPVRAGVKI